MGSMTGSLVRLGARRGISLIELLIVLAIMASLVGVATPIVDFILTDARILRSKQTMTNIRKAFENRGAKDSHLRTAVEDCDSCPLKHKRPEYSVNVGALVPQYFNIHPLDGFGKPIYRMGNFIVTNGPDGEPSTPDDAFVPINTFADVTEPEIGLRLTSPLENEAIYQVGALAMWVRGLVADGQPLFPSMAQVFESQDRGSPRDPWNREYEIDLAKEEVFSAGPDTVYDTPDDIRAPYGNPVRLTDDFEGGIRDWYRLFPTTLQKGSSPAHAAVFPPTDPNDPEDVRAFRLKGMGSGAGVGRSETVWLKMLPPGLQAGLAPTAEADVAIRRPDANTRGIQVGIYVGFEGLATGLMGKLTLDGQNVYISIDYGIPRARGRQIGPEEGPPLLISTGAGATPTFHLAISGSSGSDPTATFSVTGSATGTVIGKIPRTINKGSMAGIMAVGLSTSTRFNADFDNFEIQL